MKYKKIYSYFHFDFFDKILKKKREDIYQQIIDKIDINRMNSILDVGTSSLDELESSNYLIKKFISKNKTLSSISVDKINLDYFNNALKKSITENFTKDETDKFSADLVISNATIEHVGEEMNQKKMIENIINLTKKYFVIITPNRFHPLEFHTKLPFIHWLPKKIHRYILKLMNFSDLALEENLNLVSINEFKAMLSKSTQIEYYFVKIKFLFFPSNIILIGKKIK
tara:strand:- start:311 stop:991 length:681 start_codon:yes stop_codon:yes gene_type:complete